MEPGGGGPANSCKCNTQPGMGGLLSGHSIPLCRGRVVEEAFGKARHFLLLYTSYDMISNLVGFGFILICSEILDSNKEIVKKFNFSY